MHFDYYLRKEYNLFGKNFEDLLNNMKNDEHLELKHKECLEYYKDDELNSYKQRIEPIVIHILNTNKEDLIKK